MARKRRGVNLSEAIRTFLKDNPDIGPTEAAAIISKQVGKKVSPIYVSNVKSLSKGKAKKSGRRGRKPGPKPAVATISSTSRETNHTFDIPTLEGLMKIVRRVGKDTAKRLMDLFDDKQG